MPIKVSEFKPKVLEYIRQYQKNHTKTPSTRNIQKNVGVSKAWLARILEDFERDGVIRKVKSEYRIEILSERADVWGNPEGTIYKQKIYTTDSPDITTASATLASTQGTGSVHPTDLPFDYI